MSKNPEPDYDSERLLATADRLLPHAMKTAAEVQKRFAKHGLPTPPSIIISEWLAICQAGQWTPLEAALKIIERLREAGYQIVLEKK